MRQGRQAAKRRIVFTGGGTAGHVTPALPLIAHYQAHQWVVDYIGSGVLIERDLILPTGATYHHISTGKLKRYLTWVIILDALKVLLGLCQAFVLLRRLRPVIIFSKGGYVAFPVVLGGWLNRIPVVIHESDLSPGLANRLSYPFARKVCFTFAETQKRLPVAKAVHTGAPVRPELLIGDAQTGRRFARLDAERPIVLVVGGSQGARLLNEAVRAALPELLADFQVIHLCGAGHLSPELEGRTGYCQLEFVGPEMGHLMAAADLAVSRAGSGSLLELLSLKLPHLLVPLGTAGSRGDQIENAALSAQRGWSLVLPESALSKVTLPEQIRHLYTRRDAFRAAMASVPQLDPVQAITTVLDAVSNAQLSAR